MRENVRGVRQRNHFPVPELAEGEKKALIFSAGLRSAKGPAEKENFALFPSTSSGTRSIHFLALYKLIGYG